MASVDSAMMLAAISIPKTFGASLMGTLFASWLSGSLAVQMVVYFKMYPEDNLQNKCLVLVLWIVDILHTVLMWVTTWGSYIDHFGDASVILVIPWTISLEVLLTGLANFLYHIFWVQRIFQLSKRNYWLTIPILFFVVCRVGCSIVSVAFMIKIGKTLEFTRFIGWNFTLGLTLSSLVDVIVTISLFILLRRSRTGADTINAIISSLIWYTFETGLLTSAVALSTLICWVAFPNTLIFLGIQFNIIKLYSNTLLANLNLRRHIREANSFSLYNDPAGRVRPFANETHRLSLSSTAVPSQNESKQDQSMTVEVNVQRSVHFNA